MKTLTSIVAVLLIAGTCACSDAEPATDDTTMESEETTSTVTAPADPERRDRAVAVIEEIQAILDDPGSFGTEQEVADLIATHATATAVMDDDVFGAVSYRMGFYNTLYGGTMDAEIDVHHISVSDDGSQGVILWMWHGTNAVGNPFELAGISLTHHDEDGLVTDELVTYPYPDDYVREAVQGAGTETPVTGHAAATAIEGWNPILAERTAQAPPEPATCPETTDPDVAGESTGPRAQPSANQGAVFDPASGRILMVDGVGETWAFDVCTNTWTELEAVTDDWLPPMDRRFDAGGDLVRRPGNLVHDIDSGVTIATDLLGVYDAATNTWTHRIDPLGIDGFLGAVYDPVSGLVVVAAPGEAGIDLHAYDVDTDTWTPIGTLEVTGDHSPWLFLIGYSSASDELVFHGPDDVDGEPAGSMTVLVNPRTGATTSIHHPDWQTFAAWGMWYPYATGVDGAVVGDAGEGRPWTQEGDVCVFDPAERTWDGCTIDSRDGPYRSGGGGQPMVYDPMNDRLVVIYPGGHPIGQVWAVDLGTGAWIELTA